MSALKRDFGEVLSELSSPETEGAIAVSYQGQVCGYLVPPNEYTRLSRIPLEMLSSGDFDSPAMVYRSSKYPEEWGKNVPARVRIKRTVSESLMGTHMNSLLLPTNGEYPVWTNSHGTVYLILSGRKIQLNADEYDVIEWTQCQ